MDRVLALLQEVEGSTPTGGTCPNDFFRSNRPGYPHPVSSELEIVVSEWRSVIAVSLNVGGGVRLIKPAKLYMCTQNTTKRTHGAGCVRQWFRTAEPLGERRYENWNTHTQCHSKPCGEPGLVDRVLALLQEVEGSTPTGDTCPTQQTRTSAPSEL